MKILQHNYNVVTAPHLGVHDHTLFLISSLCIFSQCLFSAFIALLFYTVRFLCLCLWVSVHACICVCVGNITGAMGHDSPAHGAREIIGTPNSPTSGCMSLWPHSASAIQILFCGNGEAGQINGDKAVEAHCCCFVTLKGYKFSTQMENHGVKDSLQPG